MKLSEGDEVSFRHQGQTRKGTIKEIRGDTLRVDYLSFDVTMDSVVKEPRVTEISFEDVVEVLDEG